MKLSEISRSFSKRAVCIRNEFSKEEITERVSERAEIAIL